MTRLAKRIALAAAIVAASAGVAKAEMDLDTPEYRPYITEVGKPIVLNLTQFRREVAVNSDLKSWIRNYGYPDVAEIQRVVPEYGWADYEVRIYYFAYDIELAFGRVAFMPAVTDPDVIDDYGLVKFQGRMQPENRKRVQYEARLCGSGKGSSADRIIAAADRATRAAELAEKESVRAMQAAERAESAVNRMDAGFRQGLRK